MWRFEPNKGWENEDCELEVELSESPYLQFAVTQLRQMFKWCLIRSAVKLDYVLPAQRKHSVWGILTAKKCQRTVQLRPQTHWDGMFHKFVRQKPTVINSCETKLDTVHVPVLVVKINTDTNGHAQKPRQSTRQICDIAKLRNPKAVKNWECCNVTSCSKWTS